MIPLRLELATPATFRWAQRTITVQHYLHAPVDARTSPLAYVLYHADLLQPVGCLIFGRPEATRCYSGQLLYGSVDDVNHGRASCTRWQVINLARVWLSPLIQSNGAYYLPNAASYCIAQALRRVVVDYLVARPPCFPDEPWELRWCLSYCDPHYHTGALYRASNFTLVRQNERGLQTYARPLRYLSHGERAQVLYASQLSQRSRSYRSARILATSQPSLFTA